MARLCYRLVDGMAFAALRWSAERQRKVTPVARFVAGPLPGETPDDTARRVLEHMRLAGFGCDPRSAAS